MIIMIKIIKLITNNLKIKTLNEIKEKEEKIKNLEDQLNKLKEQNEGFKKQIITLNGMVKSFRSLGGLSMDENDEKSKDKQVTKLTKEIEKLNLTLGENKEKVTLLLNEINNEKSNSHRLKEENNKLLEEINNLKKKKSAPNEETIMRDAYNILTEENLALKEELDKIKYERERLKTEGDENIISTNKNNNNNYYNYFNSPIKINNNNSFISYNSNNNSNNKKEEDIRNKLEEKEKIIKKLSKKNKELEEDFYNHSKELKYLQKYISELEEGIGSSEQMDDLRNALEDKDELIKNLSNQINQYQNKCDLILKNVSNEDKDKKIEILIKEIKVIKQKIIDLISFNGRIENYNEFVNVINLIKNNINQFIDSNDELNDAIQKLDNLMSCYQVKDDISKMKLLREISKD